MDYSKKNLMGFDFSGRDLRGIKFCESCLTDCNFTNANLQGADFSRSVMDGVIFSGADLKGAKFNQVSLPEEAYWKDALNADWFVEKLRKKVEKQLTRKVKRGYKRS